MTPALKSLGAGLSCKCPRCGSASLYHSKWSIELRDHCPECNLAFHKCDAADGPAVFLIFILGAALVPLALAFEFTMHPPLWLHAILWGNAALALTIGGLRPVKSYVITLQYKHRPEMFE